MEKIDLEGEEGSWCSERVRDWEGSVRVRAFLGFAHL